MIEFLKRIAGRGSTSQNKKTILELRDRMQKRAQYNQEESQLTPVLISTWHLYDEREIVEHFVELDKFEPTRLRATNLERYPRGSCRDPSDLRSFAPYTHYVGTFPNDRVPELRDFVENLGWNFGRDLYVK